MFVRTLVVFTVFSFVIIEVDLAIEPFVVGGDYADIEDYPHSAFLAILSNNEYWICGSSIVNQKILLTAAHCLDNCKQTSKIGIIVGSIRRDTEYTVTAKMFVINEKFNPKTLSNDIALLKTDKEIHLGLKIKRIAIMKNPPHYEVGDVAGWGSIDEINSKRTMLLKHVKQKMWSRIQCQQILTNIPIGCLCGGESNTQTDYVSRGDSGSALIVGGYIQVGIVSHKMTDISRSLVVYTNVSFFYKWINSAAKMLYC